MDEYPRTYKEFLNIRSVQIIIIVTSIFAITILVIAHNFSAYAQKYSTFIEFSVELVAVGVGITLGQYWGQASQMRRNELEKRRVIRLIAVELRENLKKLKVLYMERDRSYLPLLMQTTMYDIHNELMGEITRMAWWSIGIVDIYHSLHTINENIKEYPKISDAGKIPFNNREDLINMRDSASLQIKDWLETAEKKIEEWKEDKPSS